MLRTSADDADRRSGWCTIEQGIDAWLDEHQPDAVAVERVFARSDSSTVMGTAQASGIAHGRAARRGLPIALHTPSEVKAAVSGSGRADKAQVGAMVTRILRLDAPPKPADAADALALAITHIWRGGAQARIDAALAAAAASQQEHAMIAFVRGQVAAVTLTSAVARGRRRRPRADVHARHPRHAAHRPDGHAADSMVVREDSLTLFGFLDDDEKQVFELVQTASGVGPKLAQAMLAVLTPDDLRRAVAGDDVKTLTRCPASARRAPSGSSSSSRTGSAPRSAARPPRRAARRPRRGATRCTRAWSGSAGRPGTPRRPSRRSPTEAGDAARRRRAAARRPAHA